MPVDQALLKNNRDGRGLPPVVTRTVPEFDASKVKNLNGVGSGAANTGNLARDLNAGTVQSFIFIAVLVVSSCALVLYIAQNAAVDTRPPLPFPEDLDQVIRDEVGKAMRENPTRAAEVMQQTFDQMVEVWMGRFDEDFRAVNEKLDTKVSRDEVYELVRQNVQEHLANAPAPSSAPEDLEQRIELAVQKAMSAVPLLDLIEDAVQRAAQDHFKDSPAPPVPTPAPVPASPALSEADVRAIIAAELRALPAATSSPDKDSGPADENTPPVDVDALVATVHQRIAGQLEEREQRLVRRAELDAMVRQVLATDADLVRSPALRAALDEAARAARADSDARVEAAAQRTLEEAAAHAESLVAQRDAVLRGEIEAAVRALPAPVAEERVRALVDAAVAASEEATSRAQRDAQRQMTAFVEEALAAADHSTGLRREMGALVEERLKAVRSETEAAVAERVAEMVREVRAGQQADTERALAQLERTLRDEIDEAVLTRTAPAHVPADVLEEEAEEGAGVLSYIDSRIRSQLANATASFRDEVERLVHEDGTAMPDFALRAAGALVADYSGKWDLANLMPGWMPGARRLHGPEIVLEKVNSVGECWAFPGSEGFVEIAMPRPVRVTAVTVDHAPRSLSSHSGEKSSAPRRIRVVGSDGSEKFELGVIEYALDGKPTQTFPVAAPLMNGEPRSVSFVRYEVQSNYGAAYTCIYRVRVHGTPA